MNGSLPSCGFASCMSLMEVKLIPRGRPGDEVVSIFAVLTW